MTSALAVPEGYSLHTENSAHLLLPAAQDAFLNPVQEFNRDLSVACIHAWADEMNAAKEARWRASEARPKKAGKNKRAKTESGTVPATAGEMEPGQPIEPETAPAGPSKSEKTWLPAKFVILEALSATGLRSIRYAKEIPLVDYVIANDLSPDAVLAMQRNIDLNGLGPVPEPEGTDMQVDESGSAPAPAKKKQSQLGKVRVNQGDACALMFNHRAEKQRVDVVDLDPYGSATQFIDPAVQSVRDGGLLCVTCTDLSVLASTNYPEKCYANYGGVPAKAEYCHEAALRLVLHSLATAAARYGRHIEPLVSLSIDFYVRVFVRVKTAPIQVKKLASNTAVYYVCSGCQAFHEQPLGRAVEKKSAKSDAVNLVFKLQSGPPVAPRCGECGSSMHLAGPMWSAPIHDRAFVAKVLEHVQADPAKYGTSARMLGMLTVAHEELDVPFYFTPSKVAGFFHCETPSLDNMASALLHAGYEISRSHACPGSLKTTATRAQVHDIMRAWVKTHPVNFAKVSEASPTRVLLAKESTIEADFSRHPKSVSAAANVKLVRYQQNPLPNWGPGKRPEKRKHTEGGNDNGA